MRNLFDQYHGPENRLTHALAVCLDEDRRFLGAFLGWLGLDPPARAERLVIAEQSLPGDPPDRKEEDEDDVERQGLPDIVIHDDGTWCLLIESKVMAALTLDQLARHERTLRRRGYEQVHRLALTRGAGKAPPRTLGSTWSQVYEWLGRSHREQEWPERLRSYLRAAEVRLAREGYLTEGTLTMFDGFPFSPQNPYTYGEAKRLIKLAMAELRKDRSLAALGVDRKAPGRSAITGSAGRSVWDFLSLADRPREAAFTAYPHLTLSVAVDHLEVAVTVPNGVVSAVRRRLVDLDVSGLVALNAEILRRARRIESLGASLYAYALQRHYPSQRASSIEDARLRFKLETSQASGRRGVVSQPEWVAAFAQVLRGKRANIQFGYAVDLPWGTPGLATKESVGLIGESWSAFKPLLDVLRGR